MKIGTVRNVETLSDSVGDATNYGVCYTSLLLCSAHSQYRLTMGQGLSRKNGTPALVTYLGLGGR